MRKSRFETACVRLQRGGRFEQALIQQGFGDWCRSAYKAVKKVGIAVVAKVKEELQKIWKLITVGTASKYQALASRWIKKIPGIGGKVAQAQRKLKSQEFVDFCRQRQGGKTIAQSDKKGFMKQCAVDYLKSGQLVTEEYGDDVIMEDPTGITLLVLALTALIMAIGWVWTKMFPSEKAKAKDRYEAQLQDQQANEQAKQYQQQVQNDDFKAVGF